MVTAQTLTDGALGGRTSAVLLLPLTLFIKLIRFSPYSLFFLVCFSWFLLKCLAC